MARIEKFVSDLDSTKVFDTLEEQLAFDSGKRNEAVITSFLNRHYPDGGPKSGPARAIAGKAVAKWLAEKDAEAEQDAEAAGE